MTSLLLAVLILSSDVSETDKARTDFLITTRVVVVALNFDVLVTLFGESPCVVTPFWILPTTTVRLGLLLGRTDSDHTIGILFTEGVVILLQLCTQR